MTTEHPLAEQLPTMLQTLGNEGALRWWLRWAMEWPTEEAFVYSREAIVAMAKGDEDYVIMAWDTGDDLARAFQWVRLFALEPFVEAERGTASTPA
jgi:hypothetical protein